MATIAEQRNLEILIRLVDLGSMQVWISIMLEAITIAELGCTQQLMV